ncbi:MAG: hypothetical protein U1F83_12500 [Verrucomicrobiota bacterium]
MNQRARSLWKCRPLSLVGLVAVLLALRTSVALADEPVAIKTVVAPGTTNMVAQSPWQRIVMIGASATAGFTGSEPFGGTNTPMYALNRYVDAALTVSHEPVQNLGNAFFFFQPQLVGQQQITRALTNNPTLIIGLDFPFWFCYGEGDTDEARLQRFEQGLKLLESIPCPLVVGDIPDASAAVDKMLRADQMPSLQAIARANERLKAWAAGRPNVGLVALSDFMRNALANRPITLRDYKLPEGQTRILIQGDALHPSPPGCSVLALAVLEAYQATRPAAPAEEFVRDPKAIFRKVFKPSASADISQPVSK